MDRVFHELVAVRLLLAVDAQNEEAHMTICPSVARYLDLLEQGELDESALAHMEATSEC